MSNLLEKVPFVATALLMSILGIAGTQPIVAKRLARVHERSDIYPLAPPDQLPLLSLGYRAATADLIWAYVLVAQGLRMVERRKFDHGPKYFDAIYALDPTYRDPYLYADSILTFGAVPSVEEDYRRTRAILERGMAARPNDAKLFLVAGNFMAYVAVEAIPESEQSQWRLDGARAFQRAAEIGSDEDVQWHALAGVGLLRRGGERDAAIDFLERVYRITEDEELRKQVLTQLRSMRAEEASERARDATREFEKAWRAELPYLSRSKVLLLGPMSGAIDCVGAEKFGTQGCVHDWNLWTELRNRRVK
ncbi:MAG: hypothetical protein U0165_15470 [Polyangiaceae bacterium]